MSNHSLVHQQLAKLSSAFFCHFIGTMVLLWLCPLTSLCLLGFCDSFEKKILWMESQTSSTERKHTCYQAWGDPSSMDLQSQGGWELYYGSHRNWISPQDTPIHWYLRGQIMPCINQLWSEGDSCSYLCRCIRQTFWRNFLHLMDICNGIPPLLAVFDTWTKEDSTYGLFAVSGGSEKEVAMYLNKNMAMK